MSQQRIDRELEHGRKLSEEGAEKLWGWDTPAGARRAARRAGLIADAAGLGAGVSALEIGCGTGMFTAKFAARGANIVALELSPDLIAKARARGLPEKQVRFVAGDFMTSDPGQTFDAVVGSSVLHHLDVAAALSRILKLLRPGGVMVFAEPNMLNPQVFLERHLRNLFPYVSPDETAFVRFGLATLMKRCGFDNVRITPFDWLHPAVPQPLISSVSLAGGVLEIVPGVREFAGSLLIAGRRPKTGGAACHEPSP